MDTTEKVLVGIAVVGGLGLGYMALTSFTAMAAANNMPPPQQQTTTAQDFLSALVRGGIGALADMGRTTSGSASAARAPGTSSNPTGGAGSAYSGTSSTGARSGFDWGSATPYDGRYGA